MPALDWRAPKGSYRSGGRAVEAQTWFVGSRPRDHLPLKSRIRLRDEQQEIRSVNPELAVGERKAAWPCKWALDIAEEPQRRAWGCKPWTRSGSPERAVIPRKNCPSGRPYEVGIRRQTRTPWKGSWVIETEARLYDWVKIRRTGWAFPEALRSSGAKGAQQDG